MKKISIKTGLLFVLTLFLAAPSMAQSVNSSYFMDGSFDRHKLNPALSPERGYISLPVIGGTAFTFNGSVGLSNFLYESKSSPGMLTTFMSSEIDKKSFLNSLPDDSKFEIAMDIDILSLGFQAFGGYNTLGVTMKNRNVISIPKQMFGFMKAGLSDGNYLIEDMNVNSVTYGEVYIGHSRKIIDNLTVGVKLKFLTGVAYADANITRMKANISEQSWVVNANAELRVAAPAVVVTTNEEGAIEGIEEEIVFEGLPSNGFALDLGAHYDMSGIVEGLSVSASVTDIGSINWQEMVVGKTKNEDIVFDGFDEYGVMGDNAAEDEIEQIGEDFQEMLKLYQMPNETKRVNIGATFRLGVEYTIPFVKWISVGELITCRTGVHKYSESRTSVVLSPVKWFDLSGNVAFTSHYGTMLGFMVNLHPAGLNLFIASDGIKATMNPQMIPVDEFGANLMFGVKFPVGKRLN
ncbi:MAG: hypothetical protein J6U97_02680 [Bacteroidaceae bacterium]|nr:hypothetical protein [Bacteroidaceae bacterium]